MTTTGRRTARTALLAAALAACACSGERGGRAGAGGLAPGAARGGNLLLVTLDTTRADRLGCYGHAAARTPVLDALAEGGVRFEHAYTPVPVTLPSHATLLTGLLPPQHGVRDNGDYRLPPEAHTLAERLAEAGYATAAFVSAFVLESRYGLDQGFDLYEDRAGYDTGAGTVGLILERRAEAATVAASEWLAGRDAARPFFLWVHYFDPHEPYRPPEPWATRFSADPYDGEIAYMDASIGRLLQALTRAGARDDTLIAVVADHGEALGEHGEATHAMLIYDCVMRVPWILAGPAVPPGVVVGDLVSTADLLPTVLSLLGVPDDRERDGLDLTTRRPGSERALYLESLTPYLYHGWAPLFALRRPLDKYIEAPTPEYYDLGRDPGETTNLDPAVTGAAAARRDDLRAQLGRLLDDWPHYSEAAAAAATLDSATLEKLRALGYVGGGPPVEPTLRDPKEMIPVLQNLHRAGAAMARGRADDALAELHQALERSPQDRIVLHTLGTLYLMLGREREAEATLRRFHAIRPSADVCALLAQIRLAAGAAADVAAARALLDEAIALEPDYGLAWLTRGDLLSREGDRTGAIAAWERAALHDPTLDEAARSRIARARGPS